MCQQPEQGRAVTRGLARLYRLFLLVNLHIVAGFGLLAPVLRLQTGQWPAFEGLKLLAVPVAAAFISSGIGEAAWRLGWKRLGVLALALCAIPLGAFGLWLLNGSLVFVVLMWASPVFWEHLPILVRENIMGWLALLCLMAGLLPLARSLLQRGHVAASKVCSVASLTLFVLMVLVPALPDIGRFAHALR